MLRRLWIMHEIQSWGKNTEPQLHGINFSFSFFPFLSFSKGYKIKRLYRLSTVVSIAYIFMGERISFLIRDATFGPYKQYGITGSHLIEIDESK